jgi:Putative Ig domain
MPSIAFRHHPPIVRIATSTGLAVAAVASAGAIGLAGAAPASARTPAGSAGTPGVSAGPIAGHRSYGHDPYSPAYRHGYRLGVVPFRTSMARMRAWAGRPRTGARAITSSELSYGGGINGIGVTTGHEKVYLVFWGSQWGKAGSAGGNVTLAGDPSGEAGYLQRLFKGLGTGGETWSGVATQLCQGVPKGATSCPASNTQHVAYPTGGALAGMWADESAAAPSRATGHQLGAEAVAAAVHFGNNTAAANRNAQYVILSPTGTHPDGFNTPSGDFCGWHDWNGDPTLPGGPVTSPYGHVAFSNLPYITDAGRACGENFVNSGKAGLLDGVSIVNGHEYAETITDQNPSGGWTTSSGDETADLCEWNTGPGARSANLTLTTGTFAMQPLWINGSDFSQGTCEFTHAIVRNGGGTGGGGNIVTVTSPGAQRTARNAAVSLHIQASDSASGQTLRYAATGLPSGLTMGTSTGTITGRPSRAGVYSVVVTVTDTTGASGSADFTWTVSASVGVLAKLLANFSGGRWPALTGAHASLRPPVRHPAVAGNRA